MSNARSIIIGFILMINKYTSININLYVDHDEEDYSNGTILLPFLGVILGFVMFVISILGYIYNKLFISALILLFYCFITKCKAIRNFVVSLSKYFCSDEDSTTIETAITFIILILYFILFGLVPSTAIFMTPIVGFSALLVIGSTVKIINGDLNTIKCCENKQRIIAFAVVFIFALILKYKLILSVSFTLIIMGLIINYSSREFKKILIHNEGLIIEATQIVFLIITYMIKIK